MAVLQRNDAEIVNLIGGVPSAASWTTSTGLRFVKAASDLMQSFDVYTHQLPVPLHDVIDAV